MIIIHPHGENGLLLTCESTVKFSVCGYLEPRVRHEETGDRVETRADVLPYHLYLFMLMFSHLMNST